MALQLWRKEEQASGLQIAQACQFSQIHKCETHADARGLIRNDVGVRCAFASRSRWRTASKLGLSGEGARASRSLGRRDGLNANTTNIACSAQ